MKSNGILGSAVAASALLLAGCGEAEAPVETEAEASGVPGMSVENARLMLAPVAGNPAAVYFDLTYEGERALTIRKAEVTGAENTMLHDYNEYQGKMQMMEALPIGITQGDKIAFEPGSRHVMVFGLPEEMTAGTSAEVTLTVSGGGTHTFEAEVREAGEER